MKLASSLTAITLGLVTIFGVCSASDANNNATAPAEVAVQHSAKDDAMRIEGEKRFRANCGRCHQSPHKFPPRMMLTVERHMRVRALVTDEDMKLIVHYLTQ
jgi:mono/diheme cytochrome c family protein